MSYKTYMTYKPYKPITLKNIKRQHKRGLYT